MPQLVKTNIEAPSCRMLSTFSWFCSLITSWKHSLGPSFQAFSRSSSSSYTDFLRPRLWQYSIYSSTAITSVVLVSVRSRLFFFGSEMVVFIRNRANLGFVHF